VRSIVAPRSSVATHHPPKPRPPASGVCSREILPESLVDAFLRGALLFDSGAFFEAHEAWEERWRVETDADSRRCLQGLIQVAAAFHKLVAKAPDSASRLIAQGLAKLDACPASALGSDLSAFREGLRACAEALADPAFDRSTIPKIGVQSAR
jgi:hypothetical protein